MSALVIVLACGARKATAPAPAIELYTGPYFRAMRRFADRFPEPKFILSAKHGLVPAARELAPYDMRLRDPGAATAENVRMQAAAHFVNRRPAILLGGSDYAALLRRAGVAVVSFADIAGRPLMMMQQAAYLRDHAAAAEARARELAGEAIA
jgi:hypothetical protein